MYYHSLCTPRGLDHRLASDLMRMVSCTSHGSFRALNHSVVKIDPRFLLATELTCKEASTPASPQNLQVTMLFRIQDDRSLRYHASRMLAVSQSGSTMRNTYNDLPTEILLLIK